MHRPGRWLLALLLAAAAATASGAAPEAPLEALLERKIGASPAQAFHLVDEVETARRGLQYASLYPDLLARFLLYAYVDQLAGHPTDPDLSVRRAIAIARGLPEPAQSRPLQQRWDEQVRAGLALALPAASVPLPDELSALADRLAERAPGLWGGAGSYLLLEGSWRGRAPLADSEFGVLLEASGRGAVAFACSPARGQPGPVLLHGQQARFLCRGRDAGAAEAAAAMLASGATLRVSAAALGQRSVAERLVRRMAAWSRPAPALVQAAPAARTPQRAAGTSFLARLQAIPFWLKAVVVLVGYFGLARVAGNASAAFLLWLLGTGYQLAVMPPREYWFGDNWFLNLIAGGFLFAFMLIPVAAAFGCYALYGLVQLGRENPRALARQAAGAVLGFGFLLLMILLDL